MRRIPWFLFYALCASLLGNSLACAQQAGDVLISNGVYLNDPTIKEVSDLWQNYLHSRPDSSYDNPFWNDQEKKGYKSADLLTQTHLGNIYELMKGYKPTILSITPTEGYYKIRTLFAQQADSGFCDPVAITVVYAKKTLGKYVLYNSLPIATKDWQHHTVGSLTFVFPSYHNYDPSLAKKLSLFIDSIATLLHQPTKAATYYFADTKEELYHAQGLDYFIGEGNKQTPAGFTDADNNIIYGAGVGEWYPHEFVHLYVNPIYPKADPFLLEGIATLFGGSKGYSLNWHIRHADSLFRVNKDINIDSSFSNTWSANLDYMTGPSYLFGGLICKMAYEKGKIDLLLKVLKYGPTPEEGRYKVLKEIFGIERKDSAAYLRKRIADYAVTIPIDSK